MIEVTVARIGLDSASNAYVVFLQEKGGSRLLPIWIGKTEAEAILMEMNDVRRERPMTHDLCKNLIVGLGGQLRRVQITKVQKATYFAELHLRRGDQPILVDARPSDSIAIALRLQAPIFAHESLLTVIETDEEDDDAIVLPSSDAPREVSQEEISAEELKAYLENLRPEDFGKFNP